MDAIVIDRLTKAFKSGWPRRPPVQALSGLSLTVRKGEIYGFLGPNGAGKTTTLKILLGLMTATSGSAEVLGVPAGNVNIHQRIGFLPESPYFYDYLTGEEFLLFYGRLARLTSGELSRKVTCLLEMVGLSEARTRQLRKFSKGMLQRIGLAQALIHDPELIILDEPMSGLDPVGRKQIRDLIVALRDKGKTVFFSTHIIPDVEMICDSVGIVVKGKLLAAGRVDDLVSNGDAPAVEIVCEGIKAEELTVVASATWRTLPQRKRCLIVLRDSSQLEEMLAVIRAHGGRLISIVPQKGTSLEDLFLKESDRLD